MKTYIQGLVQNIFPLYYKIMIKNKIEKSKIEEHLKY